MNKRAFLHISDIHISNFTEQYSGKEIQSNFSKYSKYQDVFIDDLEKYVSDNGIELKTIIVSGDLANNGENEDYEKINNFFSELVTRFKINNSDLLIVPGNHDVNWFENEKAWRNEKNKEKWKFQLAKFAYFKKFFDDFYNDENTIFEPEKAITISKIYEDIKLCFIGLNSCYKESYFAGDHYGYINEDSLVTELETLLKDKKGYRIIAFWHHNPVYVGDNGKSLTNWGDVQHILLKHNIYNFLFGHQHKEEAKKITTIDEYNFFSTGSLGKVLDLDNNNSFNLFIEKEIKDDVIHFEKFLFKFMPDDSDTYRKTGYWEKQDNIKGYKDLKISIKKGYSPSPTQVSSKEKTPLNVYYEAEISFEEERSSISTYNENKIITYLEKGKLIKSGHFHWSGDRKTRTWIDTNKLFSSKENLDLVRADFIEKINKLKQGNIFDKIDLIIGLGIEGNIIASPLSVVFNCYYTYYPVPKRTDHNEFEKEIISGNFKNIILITDVVFEGSTIIDFIESKKSFFKNINNLVIYSVFYTGNGNIYKKFKDKVNIDFKFRYLTDKIKIEKCNIDINNCSIYKLKLETIYEF